ncbi:MAG: adenylyltransferase/cytidyltransferase family protein [Conexivisphaera sp.]
MTRPSLPAHEILVLRSIFRSGLGRGPVGIGQLSEDLSLPADVLEGWLGSLESRGLVRGSSSGYELSDAGRSSITVVLTGGVFDLIHPGHVYTLERARALGDVLVVVVARDVTVQRNKGRPPLHGEELRLRLVSALRMVDVALLGSTSDIMDTVELVSPDIIALGYDQIHSEEALLKAGSSRGLRFRVVRLDSPYPDIKTSSIRSKLGI